MVLTGWHDSSRRSASFLSSPRIPPLVDRHGSSRRSAPSPSPPGVIPLVDRRRSHRCSWSSCWAKRRTAMTRSRNSSRRRRELRSPAGTPPRCDTGNSARHLSRFPSIDRVTRRSRSHRFAIHSRELSDRPSGTLRSVRRNSAIHPEELCDPPRRTLRSTRRNSANTREDLRGPSLSPAEGVTPHGHVAPAMGAVVDPHPARLALEVNEVETWRTER